LRCVALLIETKKETPTQGRLRHHFTTDTLGPSTLF